MKKNIVFTFCFALLPGFGQMYQGYMRRGVSLLFWVCSIIMLSVISRVDILLVLLLVIWAYSFFDTFNIRQLTPEQRAAFGDDFIPSRAWLNSLGGHRQYGDKLPKFAGWLCIGVGVIMLYGTFEYFLSYYLWSYFPLIADLAGRLPALLIAAAVIFIGIRILTGKGQTPQDDDAPTYKGGESNG